MFILYTSITPGMRVVLTENIRTPTGVFYAGHEFTVVTRVDEARETEFYLRDDMGHNSGPLYGDQFAPRKAMELLG